MKNYKLMVFILLVCMVQISFGQSRSKNFTAQAPEYSLNAGFSIPTGDFEDNILFPPETGFSLGGDIKIPISNTNTEWVSSLNFMNNTTSLEKAYGFFGLQEILDEFQFSPEASTTSWRNLNLLSGVKLLMNVSPKTDVYAIAQAGLNFVYAPTVKVKFNNYKLTEVNNTSNLAFMIGGGLLINQVSIGLRYFELGESKLNYKIKTPSGKQKTYRPITAPISMLNVVFAYHF